MTSVTKPCQLWSLWFIDKLTFLICLLCDVSQISNSWYWIRFHSWLSHETSGWGCAQNFVRLIVALRHSVCTLWTWLDSTQLKNSPPSHLRKWIDDLPKEFRVSFKSQRYKHGNDFIWETVPMQRKVYSFTLMLFVHITFQIIIVPSKNFRVLFIAQKVVRSVFVSTSYWFWRFTNFSGMLFFWNFEEKKYWILKSMDRSNKKGDIHEKDPYIQYILYVYHT